MYKGYPEFAFLLWASGAADEQCAADMDLPIPKWQRVFWNIRGSVLCFLFGWWWWVKDTRAQHRVHWTLRLLAFVKSIVMWASRQ